MLWTIANKKLPRIGVLRVSLDGRASTVFKFLISRLRFLNVVTISEASDDSPRDFQDRLPKKGGF